MNKEEIIKISTILKKELPLTTGTLTRYGFSSERIEELVKEKIFDSVSFNQYRILNVETLYKQGIEFLIKKDYALADKYFEVCYKVEPQNREVSLQMLLRAIKQRKYKRAYELFDDILQVESINYQEYNNIYLYLISYLPSCPKKYLDRARNIGYNDMTFSANSNEQNKNKINAISENLCEGKYILAIRLINDVIAENPNYQVKYQLLKELLSQVTDREKEFQSKLTNLAEEEEYHRVLELLEERQMERNLNDQEVNVILLAKSILNILETRMIPKSTIDKTDKLTEAIKGNNFSLAMQINSSFRSQLRRPEQNDPLNILLIKITEIIDVIRHEEYVNEIEQKTSQFEPVKAPNEYDFAVTSELFDELRKDEHIPSKHELAEAMRVIDITTNHELQDAEDLAYYLKEQNIPLNIAAKRYGIVSEEVLLIKLIYVRDYYAEGEISQGDKLLHEVEVSFNITPKVTNFLKEVKANRNQKNTPSHTRKKEKR